MILMCLRKHCLKYIAKYETKINETVGINTFFIWVKGMEVRPIWIKTLNGICSLLHLYLNGCL